LALSMIQYHLNWDFVFLYLLLGELLSMVQNLNAVIKLFY
jgi:hypothetical protein